MIEVALQALALVVGGAVALPFLYVGIRLLKSDPAEYERNRQRCTSMGKVFLGKMPTIRNGVRDPGTAAGLTIVRKRIRNADDEPVVVRQWEPRGRLSRDSIDALLR
jgi:hypothetical protein